MGRIIGIDFGRKRIGLAVSDPLNIFASPLNTVNNQEFEPFIDNYLKTETIECFVIGYPVQMNNEPSESVKYLEPFIRRLKKKYPTIPVNLADERFTSQMAMRSMIEGGMKKTDRMDKSVIDKVSAAIILQSWLDRKTNTNNKSRV